MNHPVPVLSGELADLLDDASPAEDAATDAAVAAFIAAHRAASRPEILAAGWVEDGAPKRSRRHRDTTARSPSPSGR